MESPLPTRKELSNDKSYMVLFGRKGCLIRIFSMNQMKKAGAGVPLVFPDPAIFLSSNSLGRKKRAGPTFRQVRLLDDLGPGLTETNMANPDVSGQYLEQRPANRTDSNTISRQVRNA
jgi:hypothetical protein